jgi:hypothetical protein
MRQADISKVKEQAIETEPTVRRNASQASANTSGTGGSIVNKTGKAMQTFANKTTGILGNISREIFGNK